MAVAPAIRAAHSWLLLLLLLGWFYLMMKMLQMGMLAWMMSRPPMTWTNKGMKRWMKCHKGLQEKHKHYQSQQQ
jgi:hypothetical protein